MRPRALDLYHVAVPLRKPIKHASHERTTSDNLIVRITLADGTHGYGEGVPRDYVTGETIASCFELLEQVDLARLAPEPTDLASLARALAALEVPGAFEDERRMFGNAARCGLELAVLDAYTRRLGQPVGAIFRAVNGGEAVFSAPRRVRYSGAITAETPRKERISAWKMRLYGFHQVKVKVGVAGQDDPERLRRMRRILGRSVDVRLDANEAWHATELLERVRPLLPYRPSALEQPVPHEEVGALAELRPMLGVPVMLDESLCSERDAERAITDGLADVLNVRLSKCGGALASLRIVERAHRAGLAVQLGCHPGETGLLSAAGRHFAANVGPLRYVEGSYDRHVLRENLIEEDVTFGYGGRAAPLTGPGLGVTVNPEKLERMTVAHKEVRFD